MKALRRWLLLPGLLLLLVAGGAGCSARTKEAWYLRRAGEYFTAGQYDAAEIEYLNVVRNNPEQALAISRLGEIYFLQGRVQAAAQFLQRARQLDAANTGTRLRLAQVDQAAGRLADARAEATFVLEHAPRNPEAPVVLAEAAAKPADRAAIRAWLNARTATTDPAAWSVAMGLLALRDGDFKTAGQAFAQAQTRNPKFPLAYSAMGLLYQAQTNLALAEACFKTAAELSPPRSNLRLNYATFEIQTGHPEVADGYLAVLLQATPDFVPAWVLRAEIALKAKNYTTCATCLDAAATRDPDNYDAGLLTAQLALAQGEVTAARQQMERLARQYRDIPRVHYLLGLACYVNHDNSAAAASLSRALALNPNFTEAALLLAEIQLKMGAPEPALASLRHVLEQQPDLIQARLLQADACRVKGDPQSALVIYTRLVKADPTNAGLYYLQGQASRQARDFPAARRAFRRSLELAPANLPGLDALVQLEVADKQFDVAQTLLRTAQTNHAPPYELDLLQARLYAAQGQTNRVAAALQAAISIRPELPAAHLLLAQFWFQQHQSAAALGELHTVLTADPRNQSAWMLQGQIYSDLHDADSAAVAYEQILALDPHSTIALNNLAYLYSQVLGQLDQAWEKAKRARELAPPDPATADTLGWILFLRGDYSAALPILAEALGKRPGDADIQNHFGRASYMLAQEAPARAALQRALQLNPNVPGRAEARACLDLLALDADQPTPAAQARLEARVQSVTNDPVALQRLCLIYQHAGNAARSIAIHEALVKANPANVQAALELARLYGTNQPVRAFEMAKMAYKAAPENPQVLHELGRLAWLNGNHRWALTLLKSAVATLPKNAAVWYDLARAEYSLGNLVAARTAFQTALTAGLAPERQSSARQWLDLMQAATGPSLSSSAVAQSVAVLAADPASVPALMVAARAAEQRGDNPAAAAFYHTALEHFPDFVPAQKNLARLDLQTPGHLAEARSLATKAREAQPNDPDLTRLLGLILYQQGEYTAAANYLTQSLAAFPDDAELYYELGFAQHQLKRLAESQTALRRALSLNPAAPAAPAARRLLAPVPAR